MTFNETTINKTTKAMKKNLMYALAGALVVCAGCADDDNTASIQNPVHEGDPIAFAARAGFETSSGTTRTVYTDEFYTEGSKTYERVDWVPGTDKVRIYCEQASNPYENGGKFADYLVTAHEESTNNQDDYATLESTGGNGALQWGDVNTEHQFYAVYPSPLQAGDGNVSIEKEVVKGIMPVNQSPKSIEKKTVKFYGIENGEEMYVGEPNMNYAFLVAHTDVTPSQLSADEGLSLSFHSIATALELVLAFPQNDRTESISLTNVMLRTTDTESPLCGQFSADLRKVSDSNPYPSMSMGDESYSQNYINMSLMHDDGNGNNVPLELEEGEKVQLTFFLLPVEDLSNLELVVTTTEGTASTSLAKLDNEDVVLTAHLKNLIKNVNLPTNADDHRWLKYVDDDALLAQLSIPGTSNSYSYQVSSDNQEMHAYQTRDFEAQWKLGVRCFEFMLDRPAKDATTSLGNEKILLENGSGSKANETLSEAVSAINNHVTTDNTEFAMVIIKYQPAQTANDDKFVQSFLTYFNNLSSNIKTKCYAPNLTVNDVRGKIMFVLRAGSYGEKDRTLSESVLSSCRGKEFLLVNGWGSLQDNWAKRGYEVDGELVSQYALYRDDTENKHMESYMLQQSNSGEPSAWQTLPKKNDSKVDYSYTTNTGYNVWAQEWPRVVESETKVNIGNNWWAHWGESYNEKLKDAKATFDKAIADTGNSSTLYFNHLGGYFIDPENSTTCEPSYPATNDVGWGGWGVVYGKISDYSKKINEDFYKYILEKGDDNATGPMGVVIINRAGADDASPYLPQVICNNNFKFSLKKGTNTTTK